MGTGKVIPIDENFFCDGPYNVLLSQSLGGSGMDPHELADILGAGDEEAIASLMQRGVCLPLFFDCDCALDGATLFVIGDLPKPYDQAWVASLRARLSIPCGKLVLVAGGGDGDGLAKAVSGKAADKDYCIYTSIDVPPGDYCVNVYAYAESPSVANLHPDLDEEEIAEKYKKLKSVDEAYVIQLTPLEGEIPTPEPVEEVGWAGVFKLRA